MAQIILKDEETYEKDPDAFGDISELLRESMVNTNHAKWRLHKSPPPLFVVRLKCGIYFI